MPGLDTPESWASLPPLQPVRGSAGMGGACSTSRMQSSCSTSLSLLPAELLRPMCAVAMSRCNVQQTLKAAAVQSRLRDVYRRLLNHGGCRTCGNPQHWYASGWLGPASSTWPAAAVGLSHRAWAATHACHDQCGS